MNCEECDDKLADFLLDELPESEAVLVHEHLNLCAECMKKYRELKGTGKALDAVPVMRPVEASAEFKDAVRASAVVESAKILAALTPERRAKIEAIRASRKVRKQPPGPSYQSQRRQVRRNAWSLVLVLAAIVAAVLILFSSGPNTPPQTGRPNGVLGVIVGGVELSSNQVLSAGREGKSLFIGDSCVTREDGRARIDLNGGAALFLGPNSRLTLLAPPDANTFSIQLQKGQLGLYRPQPSDAESGAKIQNWELKCDLGTIDPRPGSHVYVCASTSQREHPSEVLVLAGSAVVQQKAGGPALQMDAVSWLPWNTGKVAESKPVSGSRVPAWRLDLVSEADLSAMLNAPVKLKSRSEGGIEAEIAYGHHNSQKFSEDWEGESNSPNDTPGKLAQRGDGNLLLPVRTRLSHRIPFGPPLTLSLIVAADSSRDSNLAFGALRTSDSGVVVDVTREVEMKIRSKGASARRETVARAPVGAVERLNLEVSRKGTNCSAVVSSNERKSSPVLIPTASQTPGQIWIHGLGEGIVVEELKISGIIPESWLSERLSQ